MPKVKRQLKEAKRRWRNAEEIADPKHWVLREAVVRINTVTENDRSFEVVIATEEPVSRFDYDRGEVVAEVLDMSGVEFRRNDPQVPIVDSHDGTTVRNVYGSVRGIQTKGDELIGRAYFASDADSESTFRKVSEGHLKDFSITAVPIAIEQVMRGEQTMVGDQSVEGPANIVRKWRAINASIVSTGADERSVVRESLARSYDLSLSTKGTKPMNETLRQLLIERGMPDDLQDDDAIAAWAAKHLPLPATEEEEELVDEATSETSEAVVEEGELVGAGVGSETERSLAIETRIERALKADGKRRREIQALCKGARIERSIADEMCENGTPLNAARERILKVTIGRNQAAGSTTEGGGARVVGQGIDRLTAAMRDGLIIRAVSGAGVRTYDPFEGAKPHADARDFQHMSMFRMVERMLQCGGINTARMQPRDIAMIGMGHRSTIDRYAIERDSAAYHTTGRFANLLLDASNKSLLGAYEEAMFTWSLWARQAPSVPDFKQINRVRYSESPDLLMVPENNPYPEGAMSDSKESYKVEKFGRKFSVTWETIVNDDLDAISRTPAMHGNAARRVQNKEVYSVLNANAAMGDGTALFHADHGNLDGSGAVISVAELNAGYAAMRTQTGVNANVQIDVTPRFLLCPVAIEATALQIVASTADPSVGGSAAGNANTANIYGPGGRRQLTVVADPVLDASSATAWYLASDANQVDTVELAFLAGEETPVLESEFDFSRDVWTYKIRQSFGTKAIDWRGVWKNPGA